MEASCIVLAGGKSLRLGRDKVLEAFGNESLLQQVISCVSLLSSDIILVVANNRSVPEYTGYPKLKVVTDIYPGKGPLGGIYSGLAASASFYNLVVAADMPFLNQALLRYMIQISTNFDLVVPRMGRLVEPLHAIYTKSCLIPIERMIKQDILRIDLLFDQVKVRYVETEEIERFDPKHLSFFNVNTKADLEKAKKIAGELNDDQY
ncbi:MAG: molybdenum cofactor guanylyltransferase [Dehalococcoidales bacterium]